MWVCRLPVHIGPADYTVFTEIFGEFVTSQRADVGIGPYNHMCKCIRIRRGFSMIRSPSQQGGQSRPPLRVLRKTCAKTKHSGLSLFHKESI